MADRGRGARLPGVRRLLPRRFALDIVGDRSRRHDRGAGREHDAVAIGRHGRGGADRARSGGARASRLWPRWPGRPVAAALRPADEARAGLAAQRGFAPIWSTPGSPPCWTPPTPLRTASRIAPRDLRGTGICRICQLLRPPWMAHTGRPLDRISPARKRPRAHIAHGSTVFLATGRQTLDRFANLPKAAPDLPPDRSARRPLSLSKGALSCRASAVFRGSRGRDALTASAVDWLIVKNAGGEAPRTKLTARARLGSGLDAGTSRAARRG